MQSLYRSPHEEKFADLPEPPAPPETLRKINDDIDDFYLNGLENYIAKLGEHIRGIQTEEGVRMQRFTKQLEKLKTKSSKRREDAEEDARQEFQQSISSIRRKRKHYRQMERDALNERRKYLESMDYQKTEQEMLRQKLLKLGALPESVMKDGSVRSLFGPFALIFFVFQVGLVLAFLSTEFTPYPEGSETNYQLDNIGGPLRLDNYYKFFVHISLMVFFGYGILSVWLKKYGYSAICFTFMITVFAFEFNYFMIGMWVNVEKSVWDQIPLNFTTLLQAIYGSAAILVTFGAVLGKITPLELLIMTFLEVIAYSVNYWVTILILKGSDPGGGMTIHLFGALFSLGITVSMSEVFVNTKSLHSQDLSSSYRSDLFALIGTILVFVNYPSFNAALAPDGTQHRVAINTVLSIVTSCFFAFLVSRTLRRKYFSVRDIQNATIAGGIAMGSAHSITIIPGAALLVGAVAATVTIIGFVWFTPFLQRRSSGRFSDTRGVIILHGLSGLIAGIASIVATGTIDKGLIYGQEQSAIFGNAIPEQAGFQATTLFITIGIATLSGLLSGLLLWGVRKITLGSQAPLPYTDEAQFLVPSDFERSIKLHSSY